MKNLSSKTFAESLALDGPDPDEAETNARRLHTYSVAALRVAAQIERVYVNHTAFADGLKTLDRLFQLGTELETPQGYLLVGPPGSGKTALFRYFRDSLPSSSLFSSSAGAIGLRVPKRPRPGLLVREFLRILKYPFAGGSYKQLYERRQLVFEALRSNGTRLVWLDEAHHLLPKHASRQIEHDETEATELLRELMDECKVSLVLAGSDELDNLKTIAPHFTTRVAGRAALGIFELDASWLGFLKAFSAQSLGFDIRLIEDRSLAKLLHFATGGNLRAFKQLILEAVLVAHDANELRLTQDHLRKAFDLVFGMACTRSNSFA